MKGLLPLLLAVCLLLPARALSPAQVVVVYNADSSLSTQSAQRYAQVRHIPAENLVPLRGLKGGHISRKDFEEKIREPLLAEGARKGWRWPSGYTRGSTRRICAMVLMPDMPLGVMGNPRPKDAPPPAKLQEEHAAVDSELMALGGRVPIAGLCGNPWYGRDFRLGQDFPTVMAVCRIDGPNEASINRMIDDPVRVEKNGLQGWTVVDHRGNLTTEDDGDGWLTRIARQARADGQPLFFETSPETLADSFPLMTDTAVYFGWYAYPANGPFPPKAAGGFRFAPGAVAVHIHSNSASSVKDAKYWAPAFLNRGAAVTAGNVFEPYLGPTLHLDVFYDRLLRGSCLAEAALAASPVISWQCIVMGDPLYRPYAAQHRHSVDNVYNEWRKLRLDARDDLATISRRLRARLNSPRAAALQEMFAWHCTEQKQWDYAAEAFSEACGRYTDLRDRTRTLIMAASVMAADGQKDRAASVLRPWLDAGNNSPYYPALLKSYESISGRKEGKR